MMTLTLKKLRLGALWMLVVISILACDIGNWDISQNDASRRNVNAWEEIDFLHGNLGAPEGCYTRRTAYPLIFGTSSQRRGSSIQGSGNLSSANPVFGLNRNQISHRFANGRPVGQEVTPIFVGQTAEGQVWGHSGVTGEFLLVENSVFNDISNPFSDRFPLSRDPTLAAAGRRVIPDEIPPGFIEIAATRSGQGGGKIAGSEDGIAFLFREVPLDRNFRMEADFLIISYGNVGTGLDNIPWVPGSNGQEGFGIMVRDFVPQFEPEHTRDQDTRMSAMDAPFGTTGRTRREVFFETDGENLLMGMVHNHALPPVGGGGSGEHPLNSNNHFYVGSAGSGADSNMILAGGTKRGMRVKYREGIVRGMTDDDYIGGGNPTRPGTQAGNFRFRYFPSMLGDYSFFTDYVPGQGEIPTFSARPDFPRWGSVVRVTLERTNDGFRYMIRNLDDRFYNFDPETGQPLNAGSATPVRPEEHRSQPKPIVSSDEWGVIPATRILGQVNRTHYYVGLFASRDAVVWVHNIRYWEADSDQLPAATPFRPIPFEPEFSIVSPPIWGGTNVLHVTANTAGRISVTQNGQTIPPGLITNEWIVERQNGIAVPLSLFTVPIHEPNEGDNLFTITFHPGAVPDVLVAQGRTHSSNAPVRRNFNLTRRAFGYMEGDAHGARHRNIYVAPHLPGGRPLRGGPHGSPGGDGTRGNPLDLQTAIHHVLPGQHIVMLDGLYMFDRLLEIPRYNDGEQGAMKVLRAETVNQVWLDWGKQEDIPSDILGGEAFLLAGSFWHLDGFHIRGAPDRVKGIVVSGHNNLITRLMTYNNGDTGFQISGRASEPVRFWPSYNTVKWVESFHNFDMAQTNADGFGAKLTVGRGNVFHASIAHHNNDDGWDLFAKRDTGATGAVIIRYSIAYRQGNMLNNFETIAGHNGFKMGGEGVSIRHEIHQSLAFANGNTGDRGHQVTSNSNPNLWVFNTTTASRSGLEAGNIEIRPGDSAGVGTGNALWSIASAMNRQNATPAPFATTEAGRPNAFTWDGNDTNWQSRMVTRPSGFWGPGGSYSVGAANGAGGTGGAQGSNSFGPVSPMPRYYEQWDEARFALFLRRDEYFTYPLLDGLYPAATIGTETFGASQIGRNFEGSSDHRAWISTYIPWAQREPARLY